MTRHISSALLTMVAAAPSLAQTPRPRTYANPAAIESFDENGVSTLSTAVPIR